jgi:hypothetical protein
VVAAVEVVPVTPLERAAVVVPCSFLTMLSDSPLLVRSTESTLRQALLTVFRSVAVVLVVTLVRLTMLPVRVGEVRSLECCCLEAVAVGTAAAPAVSV